jgi:hypothetical protein
VNGASVSAVDQVKPATGAALPVNTSVVVVLAVPPASSVTVSVTS